MVGRKILKPLAGDKLCDGFVAEHKPAGGGREEMWVLRWELESEQDEEVTKAVLDKRINLKAVQEREFPPTESEGGKPATRKDRAAKAAASPSKASAATKASKSAAKPAAKSTKASKASPKRRASAGRPLGSKSKKAKKAAAAAASADTSAGDELLANKKDVGKFVAKQFEQGIFTGRVVKVRKGSSPLWQIRYEDDDVEELNKEEALSCLELYQTLKKKFSEAEGTPVPQEEEDEPAAEGAGEEGGGDAADASKKGKEKEKGKGKVKRTPIRGGDPEAQIAVLGLRVRKSFGKVDEEYDGTVSELYPKEKDGDDELGDLWLVKYDDGDSEHMDLKEVQEGAALYDTRHALQKKEITFSGGPSLGGTKKTVTGTKIVLYAEMPAESRLFCSIEGYRADKKTTAS